MWLRRPLRSAEEERMGSVEVASVRVSRDKCVKHCCKE